MKLYTIAWTLFLNLIGAPAQADWSLLKEAFIGNQSHLFTPKAPDKADTLIVLIHGCRQMARDFVAETDFESVAAQENVFLLAPEQRYVFNQFKCWNWFLKPQQRKEGLEAKRIKLVIDQVLKDHPQIKNIYVSGISSGAAMAAILTSCYPKLFKAAAFHSGVKFKAALGVMTAIDTLKKGTQVSPLDSAMGAIYCSGQTQSVPSLVIHGNKDEVVNPNHLASFKDHQLALFDMIDDSKINGSIETEVTVSHSQQIPKYPMTKSVYKTKGFTDLITLSIDNLEHAWSGGNPGKYSNSEAPKVTPMIWKFFKEHR